MSTAALAAVLASFGRCAHWDSTRMWELTAISLVGIASSGPADGARHPTAVAFRARYAQESPEPRLTKSGFGLGVLVVVLAWALISMREQIPLISQRAIGRSEDAARVPGIF